MDTVSMLNKMSFYCQPILPLVYDESMSYYETLCKVVGQLNTTGDAVNKLNEGLTGEIADRQKGDILLDERLRALEKANKKIHFLAFAGTPPHSAGLIGTAPTRSELRQWVNNHDLIITLLETTDGERNVVYAASCTYNAGNWADETSDDFNILVPIHTSYDADKDHAISQKVAKITIPPSSQTSLDAPWGLQFIEINTPSTSADGVVNFAANIFQDGHMECNLTPFEFMNLYAPTWANRNLCVAVNAKLFYDGYTRTSSIATLNSSNHIIRIAFERDYGVFENNGVRQLNKEIDYIIGDVSHNTWTHETIDSKTLDFSRYEGFQFTRGENNVITANDESTPNAVYTQYRSDTSGKIYQNLPVRLVDTVDNAEYWNGVFDIKDNKHMTFTFVTSNYVTASGKMLVRVIELSADANTTTWKYAEKEFELPITGSFTVDDALSDTSTNPVQNKVVKAALDEKLSTQGGEVTGSLSITRGITVGRTNDDTGIHLYKDRVGVAKMTSGFADVDDHITMARLKVASPTEDDDAATKKYVDDHGAANAVLYTAQSLTFEQKQQARKNIEAAGRVMPTITGGVSLCPANVTDSNTAVHTTTTTAGGDDFTLTLDGGPENAFVRVKGIRTPTDTDNDAAANVEYVNAKVASGVTVQAPKFVHSVAEMTDVNLPYVLIPTGHIWVNGYAKVEKPVEETVSATEDNPYHDGYRLGSDASSDSMTPGANGYFLTPLIDLTKAPYNGKTIKLNLEGAQFASDASMAQWIQTRVYGTDKSVLVNRYFTMADASNANNIAYHCNGTMTIAYNSETSATVTLSVPPTYGSSATPIGYIRFCAKGAVANSNITITYTDTVTGVQWYDTGIPYDGSTDEQLESKVAEMNNEGSAPAIYNLLTPAVIEYYDKPAYPDGDYSTTNIVRETLPYRSDIPQPVTLKWQHNEDAVQTTISVNTSAAVLSTGVKQYDATGYDNFPIYNLLPNKTYYYTVTHILADGSLVTAKSGNFKTSGVPWRLLNVDGIQNVRDLGGWAGLNGKKVKYGKLFRGSGLDDSDFPHLLLSGQGRTEMVSSIGIRADLDLRYNYTESAISKDMEFLCKGYGSYAQAITTPDYRAAFKAILEWIVGRLSESPQKPVYFHCEGGCDRTGTLSFLMLGLLGVSESDLAREYELSSFSAIGVGRVRNSTVYNYSGMVTALKTYSGNTLAEKFVDFALTGCGISADTINSFRTLMLE